MEKKEAIEIIIEATKGNARKEDFFKLPNEIIGDVLDEYAKAINKNSVIPDVSNFGGYCEKQNFTDKRCKEICEKKKCGW